MTKQNIGGHLPFPPDDCKATRFRNDAQGIKWVDRAFCVIKCPRDKCDRYREVSKNMLPRDVEAIIGTKDTTTDVINSLGVNPEPITEGEYEMVVRPTAATKKTAGKKALVKKVPTAKKAVGKKAIPTKKSVGKKAAIKKTVPVKKDTVKKSASTSKKDSQQKKPGVIMSILDCIRESKNGITKDQILVKLEKLFPERTGDAMKKTINAQIGGKKPGCRLAREKRVVIEKDGDKYTCE